MRKLGLITLAGAILLAVGALADSNTVVEVAGATTQTVDVVSTALPTPVGSPAGTKGVADILVWVIGAMALPLVASVVENLIEHKPDDKKWLRTLKTVISKFAIVWTDKVGR